MRLKRSFPGVIAVDIFVRSVVGAGSDGERAGAISRAATRDTRGPSTKRPFSEYRRVPPDAGELYAQALYNIGVCHYELVARPRRPSTMYTEAVEARGGRYPKASYALGVALEELGRVPEAKEAYRRALAASGGELRGGPLQTWDARGARRRRRGAAEPLPRGHQTLQGCIPGEPQQPRRDAGARGAT